MSIRISRNQLALLTGACLTVLAGCGGSESSDALETNSTEMVDRSGALAEEAPTTRTSLVVRAYGTLANGGGPIMVIRVNGAFVAQKQIRSSSFQDHVFTVPAIPDSAKIDIAYVNDTVVDGKDRNLFVESIRVLGAVLKPSDPGVTYDRGYGTYATDGKDVIAGQSEMNVNGALRFTAPALVALASTGSTDRNPVPVGTPVIFNASSSARAGDIVYLQGENFGTDPSVWLDGQNPVQLQIVNRSGNGGLTVRLPTTVTGAIQVRIANGSVSSTPVALNGARADHLDTLQIVPGGAFRIFGRNLLVAGSSPQVMVDGVAAVVNVAASDENMLVVTAPAGLSANLRSSVTVDNGNGTPASTLDRVIETALLGSGDPFGLGVGWGAGFASVASRVVIASSDSRLAVKVACNNQQDDAPAIQAAVDLAAANAGGIVQLPAGDCRIGRTISMKSKVVIQGAGKDQTTLRYSVNYPLMAQGRDFLGVRNLALVNTGTAQEGPLFSNNSHLILQGLKVSIGTSHQLFMTGNRQVVVNGSDFVQGGSISQQGPYVFLDSSGMVFTNNTTTWVAGAPSFGRTHDAYFRNNRFTRNAANQATDTMVHSFTMDFAYRLAIIGNTFDVINGPVTNKTRNDGETLLTEGGGAYGNTENLGYVTSATATTLTDTGNTLKTDPFGTLSIPENYGVAIVGGKGAGQTRRLMAYANGTMTVDKSWQVVPDSTSRYATFVWGLERSLIKNNVLSQNPRGIWLYQTAIRDVDLIGNRITEGGGIYLRASQKLTDKRFDPIYNVRIAGNQITNTTGNWGSYIVAMFVNMDAKAFGTGLIGVEVRDNELSANPTNVQLPGEEYAGYEGYMNMMRVEDYSRFETMTAPRVMGSIFQRNGCANCEVGYRLGTGAEGTTLSASRVSNTPTLWTNWKTTISAEVATRTLVE